jgi:hypothetical protein
MDFTTDDFDEMFHAARLAFVARANEILQRKNSHSNNEL